MHQAYLMLGSNIQPVENTRRALAMLGERVQVRDHSTCWETQSIGYDGPNFINLAVWIQTELDPEALKTQVLRPIEQALGRVRTGDKNAPRTIDLDIVLFDDDLLDPHLWKHAHLALPIAELLPGLKDPQTGKTLAEAAGELGRGVFAEPRPQLLKE